MQWLDTSELVTDRYSHSDMPTNKSLKQSSFYLASKDMLKSSAHLQIHVFYTCSSWTVRCIGSGSP